MSDKTEQFAEEPEVSPEFKLGEEELDFGSQDLQIDKLIGTIKLNREIALSPDSDPDEDLVSLPSIVSRHSKRLGMSDDQLVSVAASQGLDLGELIQGVGREGRDAEEVLKGLESRGMVARQDREARRKGVRKTSVAKRGLDIRKKAINRLLSGEKRISVDDDEIEGFDPLEDIDIKAVKNPSQRQGVVAALVFRRFTDAGLSENQARAVLANGFAESNLNPFSKNQADGEDSHGVFQFNRSGSGEGSGYSVEELQNPKVQIDHIIKAIKERPELEEFRNPDADLNTLVKEFMIHFEKPRDQEESDIKKRQAYLGQTNRLISNAKKVYGTGVKKRAKEQQKQRDLALKLMGNDTKDYRIVNNSDFESGRSEDATVKPGSKKYQEYQALAETLTNPDVVQDPDAKDRARFIQQKIAEADEKSSELQHTFSEAPGVEDLIRSGIDYDAKRVAKKRGLSYDDYMELASKAGSREELELKKIRARNLKHAALYRTVGKIGSGAFFSYDLIDPDNSLKEERLTAEDGYFSRFSDALTSQRVQLIGLDQSGTPVYRAESGLEGVFNMMDSLLGVGSGVIERVAKGPEDESMFEAVKEGSIQGLQDRRTFMKAALSTQGAKNSDLKAAAYGSLGLLVDVFLPDPTFGLAKAVNVSGKLAKNLARARIIKGTVPKILPQMEVAALKFTDSQTLMARAEQAFRAGNDDEMTRLLGRAKSSLREAEKAEQEVRRLLPQQMNNVDIVDGRIAESIAEEVPTMSRAKTSQQMADDLSFSEFGLRRDYLHPGFQRAEFRKGASGISESQPAAYTEILNMSNRIDRFMDAVSKTKNADNSLATYADIVRTDMVQFNQDLAKAMAKPGVLGKTKNVKKVNEANANLTTYLTSLKSAQDVTSNPAKFAETVRSMLSKMDIPPDGMAKLEKSFGKSVAELAKTSAAKVRLAPTKEMDVNAVRKLLGDSLRSMSASVESRSAAHAIQRADVAKAEGIQIEPILASVANKYEEIGLRKISNQALDFRRQIEQAYPALKGDASMKVARQLDETMARIADDTGADINDIYKNRFLGLIQRPQKPAVSPPAAASKAPGSSPQVSKLAFDEELLTTKEVRDFASSLSERIAKEDISDFTADLATKTVKALKSVAKQRGLKGYSKLRKADLIEAITKNEKQKAFLPDEYLARNPEAAQKYEALKSGVVESQRRFDDALDDLNRIEEAGGLTVRSIYDAETLGKQSVKTLKSLAEQRGIENYSKLSKSKLVELIIENERKRASEPRGILNSMIEASDETSILNIGTVRVRMFNRDLAEARLIEAESIRDLRIAQLENFRRTVEGRAADTIELAEELDFIPGLIFKVRKDSKGLPQFVEMKSIELPEQLRGQGIATSMYLEAVKIARKRGLGFRSGMNPQPDAVRAYARMMDNGVPFERQTILDAEGNEAIRFVLSSDAVKGLSDDVLDARKFEGAQEIVDDVAQIDPNNPLLVEFLQDGQAVIRAMNEAATVEDFMLAINKIARRELSNTDMGALTKWLKSRGINVSHRGARFVADDAAEIQRAEDEFASAFSEYVKGRPSPMASTDSAFDRVKKFVTGNYAAARNAEADGATNTFSKEISKVFDSLLKEAPPDRFSAPNIARIVKRAVYKDMTKGGKASVLDRIERESTRLGYPISRADLDKQIADAVKASEDGREVTIQLPGPVSVGGYLAEKPKAAYSLDELMNAEVGLRTREQHVLQAPDRLPLRSKADSIKELTPSQRVDQFVSGTKGLRAVARFAYLGGDAIEDIRALPPIMREAVMDGTRKVQQVIGDSITLLAENRPDEFRKFMVGDPTITFKSGRNALSAGHNKVDSFTDAIATSWNTFSSGPNSTKARDLTTYLTGKIGAPTELTGVDPKFIQDAFREFVFSSQSSRALQDIFASAGLYSNKADLTPKHYQLLESLLYASGVSNRKGKNISVALEGKSVADASGMTLDIILNDAKRIFPQADIKDPPVQGRISVLMAAYGEASAARKNWAKLGILKEEKVATNFKRMVSGEAMDTIEHRTQVDEMLRLFGFNPRFVSAANLDGVDMYVPEAVRERMNRALAQALDPDVREAQEKKNLFESLAHIGETATKEGIITAKTNTEFFAAWSFRYMKTRMVRGHFLLKTRYFWMNTFDHFNQLGMVAGFGPAMASTLRLIPQDLLANPAMQAVFYAAKKAGKDDAAEVFRRGLQDVGDTVASGFAQKILRQGKWKISVNDVLEGRKGYVLVNGVPQSFEQIRADALAYGIFASFDTSQLGTKIRRAGEEFAEKANKDGLTGRLNGMSAVIAPVTNQFSDLAKISEDIAEAWGERERLGAMITLMEMGYDSRTAARVTIDALYDYAGSMSKIDRHWLVNIFFPFWAFQKNANRQLLDTIMSPYGAYRLGVLRRSYFEGSELIGEMLYNDMVDPLGIDTGAMNQTQQDVYSTMKSDLVEEFGSLGNVPPSVRRQVQMLIRGSQRMHEGGTQYGADARYRAMKKAYKNFRPTPEAVRYKPDDTLVNEYDRRRARIQIPTSMSENVSEFVRLKLRDDGEAPFTSFLLPEQGFMSSYNHAALVSATLLAMGEEIRSLSPGYFTDEDDGQDLFGVLQPMLDLVQPDRALVASDALAAMGMSRAGAPQKVHPFLANLLMQNGIDLLPVKGKESAVLKELQYATGDAEGEAFMAPKTNYYLPPGIAKLVLGNSPLGELNQMLNKLSDTPSELQEDGIRSLFGWLRAGAGIDIREMNRKQLAQTESYRLKEEARAASLFGMGSMGSFDDAKKMTGVPDLEDLDKMEKEILERARKSEEKPKPKSKKSKQSKKDISKQLEAYDRGEPIDLP